MFWPCWASSIARWETSKADSNCPCSAQMRERIRCSCGLR
ncbi:hypothetical protein JX360_13865 [Synechococcus bigranulatus str. 'Rupite']|uniref:Uncharacterized protein n=1 Tax=Thermostichus vulcanus str. 'Rupite' TaxID=2813851 RepID=A0ABT0CDX3_THEVL|nr:hypothetical protein [Thermostichus vulcanus str. 'Rupite']